jgi:shikimate kinase
VIVRSGIVLAPGGGIVERAGNRELLRDRCRTIWLDVPAEVLIERLGGPGQRPPLTSLPWDDEVRTLVARRAPLYRECAHRVLAIAAEDSIETTFARLLEVVGAA